MIGLVRNQRKKVSQIADYTRRGKYRSQFKMKQGQSILGFQLVNSKHYKDFDLTHWHFKNKINQLNYHHLDCSEQMNTTSLIIPTPHFNHKAINYAVEKMIQCGSHEYPVRNIIKQMTARSLNSINSSTTTEQYIQFNLQTTSKKDHSNLLRVYYSMVLNPLMREEDFSDMIYRLGYQKPIKSLQILGEMAKEMEVSNQHIANRIHQTIYKQLLGITNLSTCLPQQLIQLKFADIKKFHKQYFTLPNLTIVTHGDFNPAFNIQQFHKLSEQIQANTHFIKFEGIEKNINLPKSLQLDHLEKEVPLMLVYDTSKASSQQKILLSVLSYILYDMPESPLLKWNSPQTPYPKLYGHHDNYFMIGVTFNEQPKQAQFYEVQKQLIKQLRSLVAQKISNELIEKALMHLQGSYYSKDGAHILQSCIPYIIDGQPLGDIFEVTVLIAKLLKTYRQKNIFQQLLNRFILQNRKFIRVFGRHNHHLIEDQLYNTKQFINQLNQQPIINYQQPSIMQDITLLPNIKLSDIQLFDDPQLTPIFIKGVTTYWQNKCNGTKVTVKVDISDIGEDNLNMLGIFCQAYGKMGLNKLSNKAYKQIVDKHIQQIGMSFTTVKDTPQSMKIYLLLQIQFSNRNFEYGFSTLHGIIHDFKYDNLQALSLSIQRTASKCYNYVSQDIIHFHGLHAAATKCPFAQIQDPLFHARSICSFASQVLKVDNPKNLLKWMSERIKILGQKIKEKKRWQIMVQSSNNSKKTYQKYLQLIVGELTNQSPAIDSINILNYAPTSQMKYFPNFNEEVVFESFSVPYFSIQSPTILVLSSIINNNIRKYNNIGGCFVHKGAMVAFMGGNRKKLLELEEYYQKIDQVDKAKIAIFQHLSKHTFNKAFKTNINNQKAKLFKQSILMTTEESIKQCLETFIISQVKQTKTSVLALGPNLSNYQPLIKKGWIIERSIDETSLNMESQSNRLIEFKQQRYLSDIC